MPNWYTLEEGSDRRLN